MANILYRGSAIPSAVNSNAGANRALTNLEIDQNFYSLDLAKFEKSGGTISGDTTFSTNVTVSGNLTVNGTTTTINTTNLQVTDANIELGKVATPSDTTANGGGITLKGLTDKTITWDNTNANWTSSENWNIATGKAYKINNISVLNATTLGSGVTTSSLTSVATITTGTWNASTITTGYGGTGLTTYAAGDILYASAVNTLSKLAKGSDGQILTLASGLPAWSNSTGITSLGTVTAGTWNASTITYNYGGTGLTSYAKGDVIYASAANTLSKLAAGIDGQVLKLSGGVPTWGTDNDTIYSLPLAANGTRGGVQIGFTTDATNRNYAVGLSGEKMYVNVPWTDTTYSAGTGLTLTGTSFSVNYGTSGTTACVGNDSRLSDSRPANGGTSSYSNVVGSITNDGGYAKLLSGNYLFFNNPDNTRGVAEFNAGGSGTSVVQWWQFGGGGAATFMASLDAAGNFTANSNVTANSDVRLKSNIETIQNGLGKVLSLRGVSYDKDGKRNVGVIAQEVREIIPEVVLEADDEDKTLSVAYGNIVGVLIEAIKELNAKVEDLQNQLANK